MSTTTLPIFCGSKEAMFLLGIKDKRTFRKVMPYLSVKRDARNHCIFKTRLLEKGYEEYLKQFNEKMIQQ